MEKIISAFLNPAIDITLWVKETGAGEPFSVIKEKAYAAGKGINVSKALTAFGCPNLALGVIGKENSERFRALLGSEVPLIDITEFSGKTRENLTIVLPDGKIMKINHKGTFFDKNALEKFKTKLLSKKEEAEFVIFGGKIPEGISNSEYAGIINLVSSAKVIVDTSSFLLSDYKKLNLYAIKPNHKELSAITGLNCETEEEIVKAAELLLSNVKYCLVSRGEKGLMLISREAAFSVSVPKIIPVSDIGAGDSALAGFVYAKSNNLSDEEAALWAAAAGTAKTLTEGTATVEFSKVTEIKNNLVAKPFENFE